MPKKKKIYNSILDAPFPSNSYGLDVAVADKTNNDLKDREKALFKEYGLKRPPKIDNEARRLIKLMALDLKIPGFIENAKDYSKIGKIGRPGKWKYFQSIYFLGNVESLKIKYPSKSLSNIINIVCKKYYPKENPKSLYTRYQELISSKDFIQTPFSRMIKQLGEKKDIDALDRLLKEFEPEAYKAF